MKIAVTGASGFIGQYIVKNLIAAGHQLRCWYRDQPPSELLSVKEIQWIQGDLANKEHSPHFLNGADALIHNAFWKPGDRFQNAEGDLEKFVDINVTGSIRLFAGAKNANLQRVVYVSSCAVHDEILQDRTLDEAHPLWPRSHYGAHKAAIEKFVHSYGLGHDFNICAIRPTGVYGQHHELKRSKWYDLIADVVAGKSVECKGGGKEVHAADVANGIFALLETDAPIQGQSFACYDRYISRFEVATLAQEICQSNATISGEASRPKNEIDASKIKAIGMEFGGSSLLKATITSIVEAIQADNAS